MSEQAKRYTSKTQWWHLEAEDFAHLDIVSEVERHTSTRLKKGSHQMVGACPFEDCLGDDNGFMVWSELTDRKRHYYCRNCKRSGNLVKLLEDINEELSFHDVCKLLEIGSPEVANRPKPIRQESAEEKQHREWQEKQLNWLQTYHPSFMARAQAHPRALAYFAQRGLPADVVRELALGYIPPLGSKEQARDNKDMWEMRYWTDRIIFPLADGGFTARSLHLWTPGMDEQTHKQLLDDLERKTRAYNDQMIAKYGEPEGRKHSKGVISRYKTITPHNKYFHEQVMTANEHVTFVEGPFDVCACHAAGIQDAIAVGTNRVDIKNIPAKICDVTIAFDGDVKGQEAAASWERLLKRKGIAVRRVVIPADGMGKDWSERYRLHGQEGLAALLTIEDQAPDTEQKTVPNDEPNQQDGLDLGELAEVCTICRGNVERYSNAGIAYCGEHWPYGDGQESVQFGSDLCCRCGGPAGHASPGGHTYCTDCYQCYRGHTPRWRRREDDGRWLCACYWEQPKVERRVAHAPKWERMQRVKKEREAILV